MDCHEFELFLHAYVDGEFDESDRARIEAHLESCTDCRLAARQESLFRSQLYESYHSVAESAPDNLKSRIRELITVSSETTTDAPNTPLSSPDVQVTAAETHTPEVHSPDLPKRPPLETLHPPQTNTPPTRSKLLTRVAGGVFCLLGIGVFALPLLNNTQRSQTKVTLQASATSQMRVPLSTTKEPVADKGTDLEARPIVEEAVHWHRRNVPIEVTGPSDRRVRHWFRDKVNFPVRLPRFSRTRRIQSVNLLGARLSNVRERQAAFVLYEANGNKVSVLVFNRHSPKLRRKARPVKPRRPIYFDNSEGYNVALVEDNGVTYSITSELPQHEMAELVQAAFHKQPEP